MNRDGALVSLWQDGMKEYVVGSSMEMHKVYDVIIAGGGITGITTALLLQKAGKNCAVLDAHNICFGTTGGTTAHLNTMFDTPYSQISKNFGEEAAKLLAQSAKHAITLIKQHITEYNINCGFEDTWACTFSQNEKQSETLKDMLDSCNQVGVEATYTNKIPVPIPFEKAIRINGQAKFNPVQYVYALAEAFEALDGVIVQHCRVHSVEETDAVIKVSTEHGHVHCKRFIYATHIPPGINLLHMRCAPYRSYAMAITLKNNKYPEGLTYDLDDPYHYYRTQQVRGKSYLIAGGEDHKTGHADNTNDCFTKLEAYVRNYFNVGEVAFRWSSQYFEPADGLPYIGRMPGSTSNILVAAGFGGNGMIYSQVAAKTLLNIIVNNDEEYINIFNPNRIKPIAGFANFVKENMDVVKQFVGKWFNHDKINTAVELAPGEARVIDFEGHTIALYRDEEANLHAVTPVCTHMKCLLAWNSAEKSWDCPCHGARYNMDGKVITGPADHDLEIVEIGTAD